MPAPGVIDERTGLPVDPYTTAAQRNTMAGTGTGTTATGTTPTTAGGSTDPNAGMENLTGFGARAGYTPFGANLAYENPWYILGDVFPGLQGGTGNPMYQGLRDLPFDPLAMYTIAQSSQHGAQTGVSPYLDWLSQMYKQQLTPGGKTFDAEGLIKTIFNQGKPGEAGPDNTLQAMLAAGGPSEQIRVLFNLLRDASSAGMNPMEARAYQSAVSQAGDRYGSAMMRAGENEAKSPTQWIAENAPWLSMR